MPFLYRDFLGQKDYFLSDGIHPNSQGAKKMADILS